MNGYKAAFSKQSNSSQYGAMYSQVFDHAGLINNKVSSANIAYLNLRFGDAEKDGIIGWSMGSDTAAKFLLQTDKKNFGFVVLDGGVILSVDEIRTIASKTKKLTIIYHQKDVMSSGILGVSRPRNYESLSKEELAKYKALEKELPNFKLVPSNTGHIPSPDLVFP